MRNSTLKQNFPKLLLQIQLQLVNINKRIPSSHKCSQISIQLFPQMIMTKWAKSEYFNMYAPAGLCGEMQMCVGKQSEAL